MFYGTIMMRSSSPLLSSLNRRQRGSILAVFPTACSAFSVQMPPVQKRAATQSQKAHWSRRLEQISRPTAAAAMPHFCGSSQCRSVSFLLSATTSKAAASSSVGGGAASYRPRRQKSKKSNDFGLDNINIDAVESKQYYARPVVQWYPGHIAKAERILAETIRAVDVVIEVRDARLPMATMHPMVPTWCAGTPRIVVLTRVDAIPTAALKSWRRVLEASVSPTRKRGGNGSNSTMAATQADDHTVDDVVDVRFLDAQTGTGLHGLIRSIASAGAPVHERRAARGLLARPLRVGILGYPNVGKSTLINRIIGGKKRCKTANIPGVTRSLQWIRVKSESSSSSTTTTTSNRQREFEVLDSPGVIPAMLDNQSDAMLVAACNCIGERAYDNQAVAAHLCSYLLSLLRRDAVNAATNRASPEGQLPVMSMVAPQWRQKCMDRYQVDPLAPPQRLVLDTDDTSNDNDNSKSTKDDNDFTGEDMLFAVADATCQGNPEDAARKILQDFRTGRMGPMCLQVATTQTQAPMSMSSSDDGMAEQDSVQGQAAFEANQAATTAAAAAATSQQIRNVLQQEQQERSARALEAAKERGLALPETNANTANQDNGMGSKSTIGKGIFDGW